MRIWAESRPQSVHPLKSLLELMGVHWLQLDWEGTSTGPNYSLWMWLTVVWLRQTEGHWQGHWDLSLLHVLTFGIQYSLDVYIGQPKCSREGHVSSTMQSAVPFLRIRAWWGGECMERMGGREGVGIWIGIFVKI